MSAELRSLDFHGEVVFLAAHPETGKPFIPAKPICTQLGLAWQAQRSKLAADQDLWGCNDIVIPSPGGPQTMTCLPLENLNGWLFSIQATRVKPEFREKLRAYQKECFQALDAYWRTGAAIRPEIRAAAPGATQALFEEIEGLTGLDPEPAQPERGRYSLPPLVPKVKDWQREVESARYQLLDCIEKMQQEHGWHLDQIIDALPVLADQNPDLKALMRQANARAGDGRLVSRRTIYRWRDERKTAYREISMAPTPVLPAPTGELVRELRSLYGDDGTKATLARMYPAFFGGAR